MGCGVFSLEMPMPSITERYLEIIEGDTGREIEELFSNPDNADILNAMGNNFYRT